MKFFSLPGHFIAVPLTAVAVVVVLSGVLVFDVFGTDAESARRTSDIFVNCQSGRDTNAGTAAAPLRTVAKATSNPLRPGTTLRLARGCSWDGRIVIASSGTPDAPIQLAVYGRGADPSLTGASLTATQEILQLAGSYVQVTGIHITHTIGSGIKIAGSHDTVADVEIDDVGIGVTFTGAFAVAHRVNVHDLHMVVNTPGGSDDYGAVGFDVQAADVEISNSRCTNCRAASHDFGFDGGFVEVFNYGDRLSVHHNVGQNTQGILEVGGVAADSSAQRVELRDNTFHDAHGGVWIHGEGQFAMRAAGISVVANTISETSGSDPVVLGGDLRNLTFRNNTVSTPGQVTWSGPPGIHTCNTYVVRSATSVGYPLDPTEVTVPNSAKKPELSPSCR